MNMNELQVGDMFTEIGENGEYILREVTFRYVFPTGAVMIRSKIVEVTEGV